MSPVGELDWQTLSQWKSRVMWGMISDMNLYTHEWVCVQPHICVHTYANVYAHTWKMKKKVRRDLPSVPGTHFSPGRRDNPPWSTGWVVCNPGWQISSAASASPPPVEYFQSYSVSEGKSQQTHSIFAPGLRNFSTNILKLPKLSW